MSMGLCCPGLNLRYLQRRVRVEARRADARDKISLGAAARKIAPDITPEVLAAAVFRILRDTPKAKRPALTTHGAMLLASDDTCSWLGPCVDTTPLPVSPKTSHINC